MRPTVSDLGETDGKENPVAAEEYAPTQKSVKQTNYSHSFSYKSRALMESKSLVKCGNYNPPMLEMPKPASLTLFDIAGTRK